MTNLLIGIFWVLSGTIPCQIIWRNLFKENPNIILLLLSAVGGPAAGIAHIGEYISRRYYD